MPSVKSAAAGVHSLQYLIQLPSAILISSYHLVAAVDIFKLTTNPKQLLF